LTAQSNDSVKRKNKMQITTGQDIMAVGSKILEAATAIFIRKRLSGTSGYPDFMINKNRQ
jgi:hypothetical protein